MGGKYRAGLLLIAAVVIIWVSSAEVTQDIFTSYKQPFAVTYLGASLLVVYLPIAFIKDWFCSLLRRRSSRNDKDVDGVDESTVALNSPLRQKIYEMEPQCSLSWKNSEEDPDLEGRALVFRDKNEIHALKQEKELSTQEIATFGFYIAPVWFVLKVMLC